MKKPGRPTIAFVTNFFGTALTNHKLWTGVNTSAEDAGFNSICLTANPRNSRIDYSSMANVLYKFITKNNFDGLVLWSGGLWAHASVKEAENVYSLIKDLPFVNIGIPYKNTPTITIENYNGMYDLCQHMIEKHNCRNIAFIRGPDTHEEAEIRYTAYKDCLKKNNIPLNENLVVMGNFLIESGTQCIKTLLDERKCSFDTLISCSDYMLLGVIYELEKRGIKIPADLRVAGFDDIEEGLFQDAPLTTVRQPFTKMGYTSVKILADILAGKRVEEKNIIQSELIIRQSCGCPDPLSFPEIIYQTYFSSRDNGKKEESITEKIISEMNTYYPVEGTTLTDLSIDTSALLDSFLKNLSEDYSVSFPQQLTAEIQKIETPYQIQEFINYIASIKTISLNCSRNETKVRQRMLSLIQLADSIISKRQILIANQQYLTNNFYHNLLDELSRNFLATFDTNHLLQIITDIFKRFGINQFYLALYKNPENDFETSRLLLAYDNKPLPIDPANSEFRTETILPDQYMDVQKKRNFIIIPLYYENRNLGYFVFGKEFLKGSIYSKLQSQLSVALLSSMLINEKETLLEKLQEINKELEAFTYSASHDLKEPLRKIIIFSERLAGDFADSLDRDGINLLHRMEAAANRMMDLLKSLLAYSQITTKARPFTTVDLDSILDQTLSDLEILIEQKKVVIHRTLFPNIDADPVLIRQVFQNLISNAIKFQKAEKQPVVEISSEVITLDDSVEYCRIKIGDNGIGIKEKYIEQIFGIFQRLHTTREYTGTGIGLAICRRVAEKHHGTIRAESKPGEGTTFIIDLPINQPGVVQS